MKREIKFRAWDKENKYFLPITPYEWINGTYVGTNIPQKQALNTFEVSEAECNRKSGKSMFLTLDGFVVNLHPVSFDTTQSLDLSERYELMQFTGLHDKTGREIYEGDIVKTMEEDLSYFDGLDNDDPKWDETGPMVETNRDVVVMDRFPVFWLKNEDFGYEGEQLQDPSNYEVIGNIYENPELLNQ